MSDRRVVALCQQLNDPWHLGMVPEQDETKSSNGCSADIVIDIRHRKMKELLDHLVASGTSICESDREHTTISENCVLLISLITIQDY
jgi:hypothetical protein